MNMSACTILNEQDKASNLLSMITRYELGKQKAEKFNNKNKSRKVARARRAIRVHVSHFRVQCEK